MSASTGFDPADELETHPPFLRQGLEHADRAPARRRARLHTARLGPRRRAKSSSWRMICVIRLGLLRDDGAHRPPPPCL